MSAAGEGARLDLARFSAAAFAVVEPGSAAAVALTSALESAVLAHVLAAVTSAIDEVRDALVAAGHAVEPTATPGELGLRAVAEGGVLSVVATVGAGVGVRFLDHAADAEAQAPTPEEARFYAALDAARERARSVGFDALDADEQRVIALGGLEAELANGGFDQYFLNSASDHVDLALASLEAIGAMRLHATLREALAAFPGGRAPGDRDVRIALMDAMGSEVRASWERLSVRYFQVDEILHELLDADLQRPR